ncbi:MAG TPA: alkaline phosphatase family protein, partial [Kofleriaceae bacterium]|nr:alkaline phosphatase family protein [Kofleriaceae bacterium]
DAATSAATHATAVPGRPTLPSDAELGRAPRDRTIARSRDGGGDEHPGTGVATEITLELVRAGQVVAPAQRTHLLYHAPNGSDVWTLRVTRDRDDSNAPRRYVIKVQYPSVLPQEQRRIPGAFFERGFTDNWLARPYIKDVRLTKHKLSYQWDDLYAGLEDKPRGDHYVDLPDFVIYPEIMLDEYHLTMGGGRLPDAVDDPPGFHRPDSPYLELVTKLKAYGSRQLQVSTPAGDLKVFTVPEETTVTLRLYLTCWNGWLEGVWKISSPLLDPLDFDIGDFNPKRMIAEYVEGKLDALLHPKEKDAHGDEVPGTQFSFLDRYVMPYLLGRYRCLDIAWDPATRECVINYVGKQSPRHEAGRNDEANHDDTVVEGSTGPRTRTVIPFGVPYLFQHDQIKAELPLVPVPGPTLEMQGPGALAKIDHIVVLMQENRSFDHILGYLSRDGIRPRAALLTSDEGGREVQEHVDGLLPGSNNRDVNSLEDGTPAGKAFYSTRTKDTGWPGYDVDGPWHGTDAVRNQIASGMKGFVKDFTRHAQGHEQLVMNYVTDAEMPAYGALTHEFAICQRWHCSYLGGTLPNRFVSLTGDFSHDGFGNPEVNNPDMAGFYPIETPTFFDHLTDRNVSWRLFEHGYCTLRLFRNFTFDEAHISAFNDKERGFEATARAGQLPQVTFIEPDYIEAPPGNDDHAPADLKDGQRLVARIMSALLASPQWEKTLFIITYDEHGGFYDHAPVRGGAPPLSIQDDRFGLRVPAFVISPLIEKRSDGKVNVVDTVFDHTSIPATILRRFCEGRVPSMGARMAAANDVGSLLTRDSARTDFELLAREMAQIAAQPAVAVRSAGPGQIRALPTSANADEDFHNLLAFSSAVTGRGPRGDG